MNKKRANQLKAEFLDGATRDDLDKRLRKVEAMARLIYDEFGVEVHELKDGTYCAIQRYSGVRRRFNETEVLREGEK